MINNNGYASIGALSRSIGDDGFGTRYAFKNEDGTHQEDSKGYDVNFLPIDLAANAESLGAHTFRCKTVADVQQALQDAKHVDRTCCIYVETDRYEGVHPAIPGGMCQLPKFLRARESVHPVREPNTKTGSNKSRYFN